jgi:hypothetical protein
MPNLAPLITTSVSAHVKCSRPVLSAPGNACDHEGTDPSTPIAGSPGRTGKGKVGRPVLHRLVSANAWAAGSCQFPRGGGTVTSKLW